MFYRANIFLQICVTSSTSNGVQFRDVLLGWLKTKTPSPVYTAINPNPAAEENFRRVSFIPYIENSFSQSQSWKPNMANVQMISIRSVPSVLGDVMILRLSRTAFIYSGVLKRFSIVFKRFLGKHAVRIHKRDNRSLTFFFFAIFLNLTLFTRMYSQ